MPAQRNNLQGKYWILTVSWNLFVPYLPQGVAYIKGQLETGHESGFLHWQLLLVFKKKIRLRGVTALFAEPIHAELTRSEWANEYCWKEDTRVEGTQFELGRLPFKRNDKADWEKIWEAAKEGRLEEIPPNVRITSYSAIKRIEKDHLQPTATERTVYVFVGATGTGKSRRAWDEAGFDAYPKDPNTKFWDGYRGQDHVVMDEFRGKIDISNLLRWTDRYPVSVETKGSGTVFKAKKLWITSNLHPRKWYTELDEETVQALLRRLKITVFHKLGERCNCGQDEFTCNLRN